MTSFLVGTLGNILASFIGVFIANVLRAYGLCDI